MMSFGWRPQSSCYRKAGDVSGVCQTPVWWYLLLGVAVFGGLRKKGGQ